MIKVQLFRGTGFTDPGWLLAIPDAFLRIFNSFEPALLILLCSIPLWWLGRRLSSIKPVFGTALIEFQLGLIILSLVFFVSYMLSLDQSISIPVALIFFSLALIGLSITHSQSNSGWFNSQKSGHWSVMLLVSIVLILFTGILVSIIVTPELLQLFLNIIKWIWGLIERVLDFFANLFPQNSTGTPVPVDPAPGMQGQEEELKFSLPQWLTSGLRLGWNILVIGFIIVVVWRLGTQLLGWMQRRGSNSGGERESLKGAFKLDILNWIKRILTKLFHIKFGTSAKNKFKNIPPEIASIRQLYSQLLRWSAQKGHPRQISQTPDEFRFMLSKVIPEKETELDYITGEYMRSRYGSSIPSEEELQQLKQKLRSIHSTGLKSHLDKYSNKG
jgi:hypothetical protein